MHGSLSRIMQPLQFNLIQTRQVIHNEMLVCCSDLPLGRVGGAPVPMEAQVRRGLTARPPSPEHQVSPPAPPKTASSVPALQEALEEPVEEMVSAKLSHFALSRLSRGANVAPRVANFKL